MANVRRVDRFSLQTIASLSWEADPLYAECLGLNRTVFAGCRLV